MLLDKQSLSICADTLLDDKRKVHVVQMALERGLLPDDNTLEQLGRELNSPFANRFVEELRWPSEPLRSVLIRALSSGVHMSFE